MAQGREPGRQNTGCISSAMPLAIPQLKIIRDPAHRHVPSADIVKRTRYHIPIESWQAAGEGMNKVRVTSAILCRFLAHHFTHCDRVRTFSASCIILRTGTAMAHGKRLIEDSLPLAAISSTERDERRASATGISAPCISGGRAVR